MSEHPIKDFIHTARLEGFEQCKKAAIQEIRKAYNPEDLTAYQEHIVYTLEVAITALRSEQAPAGDGPSDLLAELNWCIENGNTGPRSYKLLLALRAALSTPPVVPNYVPLSCDDARLALWRAIESIKIGNKTDDELILAQAGDHGFRPMLSAPQDGTRIEILVYHGTRHMFAKKDRENWEQIVVGHWINFNGGGWTWSGMSGYPVGWRAISAGGAAPEGVKP